MKLLLPLILTVAVLTSGCLATAVDLPQVETRIVDRVEYVVRVPPKELTALPKMPTTINVNTATQATVAQWVLDTEDYIFQLRNQLIGISKFLVTTQIELDEQAKKENKANASILKPFKPLN